MINFFRKIRKQLADDNMPVKYFRYAIGEIVLVVIGILIALSINNWNETNNNKASAKLHLKTISNNIKEDVLQLEEFYKFTDTTLQISKRLTRQFQTLDPVDEYTTHYITKLLLEKTTSPNKSGLETLNNSGELAYVPKQTQELLLKYYNILDNIAAREEISNTFIKIRYEPYYFKHYSFIVNKNMNWSVVKEYYKEDPRTPKLIDPKNFLQDEELEAMVFGRHFQIKNQHTLYKEALDIANQLLNNIEQ